MLSKRSAVYSFVIKPLINFDLSAPNMANTFSSPAAMAYTALSEFTFSGVLATRSLTAQSIKLPLISKTQLINSPLSYSRYSVVRVTVLFLFYCLAVQVMALGNV